MDDTMERLQEAMNAHDPQGMAALFAEDYQSSQPVHPGREFVGRAQVLENWTAVFEGVPDFEAALLAVARNGDEVWSEWDWSGHYTDGTDFGIRGVIITVLHEGLISEGRLYVEAVDEHESSIQDAVEELYTPGGGSGA